MKRLFILPLFLFFSSPALAQQTPLPDWMGGLPIPQGEEIFLVVKGTYPNEGAALRVQKFIQQIMGTTPPDRVDLTAKYTGVNSGKYLVGMLFDSRERAQWWINFSYRNRSLPRGLIKQVKVQGVSDLPYMPDPVRKGKKRLFTGSEAIAQVKSLADVRQLAARKKLIYKITDYPRNGDLRYEVEILEAKGKGLEPVMVDFLMVSALNGKIIERLSYNLRKDILKEHGGTTQP